MNSRRFRVIQGSPAPELIAPYIYIIAGRDAVINSIYRGEDAKRILHAHGKHTQAEIHQMYPGISNPPGRSTHECRGDGVAYGAPVGAYLADWQCGFDVNDGDVVHVKAHAAKLGWEVYQPYSRGVEFHHLNFRVRPGPNSHVSAATIKHFREKLPTH